MTKSASKVTFALLAVAVGWVSTGIAAQQAPPRFTGGTDAVLVDVLVTRARQPVPNLTTADFVVLDSGGAQKAELIAVENLPVNLLLALDASASVRGPALDQLKAAAKAAVASLRPSDEAPLVTFAHNLVLGATWTTDRAKLAQAIDAVTAQGSTALSDAVFTTLGIRGKERSRTLVLLFTDGDDTASWLGPAEVLEAAQRSDAVVYGVTLPKSGGGIVATDDLDRRLRSDPRLYRTALVPLLARETGGESLPASDLQDVTGCSSTRCPASTPATCSATPRPGFPHPAGIQSK